MTLAMETIHRTITRASSPNFLAGHCRISYTSDVAVGEPLSGRVVWFIFGMLCPCILYFSPPVTIGYISHGSLSFVSEVCIDIDGLSKIGRIKRGWCQKRITENGNIISKIRTQRVINSYIKMSCILSVTNVFIKQLVVRFVLEGVHGVRLGQHYPSARRDF